MNPMQATLGAARGIAVAAARLLAWTAFWVALALGAMALILVLVAGRILLLAGGLLRSLRTAARAPLDRGESGSLYEGEFRVLDETANAKEQP